VTGAVAGAELPPEATAAGETPAGPAGAGPAGAGPAREAFRPPAAVVIWWVWVLFAAGNLVDLAVQGRDHVSLIAAGTLLLITGIVYVAVLRPRMVADPDGLTIVNPLTDHRIGWAAVTGADPADLLRVRCEWPDGGQTRRRSIYAWAVHSSRRRQVSAELRADRQARRRGAGGSGLFGGGAFGGGGPAGTGPGSGPAAEPDRLRVDTDRIVAVLTERAAQAREAPAAAPLAPVSSWQWRPVAAVAVPALILLLVMLL
jgi:uncharacterized membrane protein YgcG